MQNLFDEVATLDKRCYDEFGLSEDLLMEHAADAMADFIKANFPPQSSLLIVTGSGNNGADGITLARILHKAYQVELYLAKEPKSTMAKLQLKRAKKVGVKILKQFTNNYDVIVDALLGTGFKGVLNEDLTQLLKQLNSTQAYKIAFDIPSGIQSDGVISTTAFRADTTITMGALKKSLFLDEAKDYVGAIHVADLGVSQEVYERDSNWKLLDIEDLKLPHRAKQNSHKGSYGHTAVIAGEKVGAAILASQAALRLGSALVTLISPQNQLYDASLMQSDQIPEGTTALTLGMGLGQFWSDDDIKSFLLHDIPTVADADILQTKHLTTLLKKEQIILTPHPKEFSKMLKILNLGNYTAQEVQKRRFELVEAFSKAYPNAVLLLKGANPIIAHNSHYFINPHGSAVLAKGGSGDVLSGLIAALLAQGYSPLQAAIHGSLTHTKLSKLYEGSDFSLTPHNLIELIAKLQ